MNVLSATRDFKVRSFGEQISDAEAGMQMTVPNSLAETFDRWCAAAGRDSQMAVSTRRPEFTSLVEAKDGGLRLFLRKTEQACAARSVDARWWLAVTAELARAQGDDVLERVAPRLEQFDTARFAGR